MAKLLGFSPPSRSCDNSWVDSATGYRITPTFPPAHCRPRGPLGDVSDLLGGAIGAQAVQASWPFIEEKINQKLLVIGAVAAVAYGGLVYLILRRGP